MLPLILPACSGRPEIGLGPRAFVGLDEAFAAARPGLAQALKRGSGGLFRARYAVVPLEEGPQGLLERASRSGSKVLVTSPLFAEALSSSGWRGRIVAAEWRGPLPAGLWAASTDAAAGFRRAGRAAGSYLRALRAAQGGEAEGALLFLPSPDRPAEARDAFVAAFSAAAGFPPLVREVSDEASARAGLEELLGSDLGLLFLASGSLGPSLAAMADRPSLAIGIAANDEAAYPLAAFGLYPDEEGLAQALRGLEAAPPSGASLVLVPPSLAAGPSAELHRAGEMSFARFVQDANREEK